MVGRAEERTSCVLDTKKKKKKEKELLRRKMRIPI